MTRFLVFSAIVVPFVTFGVACSSSPRSQYEGPGAPGPVATPDAGRIDAGGCQAASRVPAPPIYTPVQRQSVCAKADVTAWINACFAEGSTKATCTTWAQNPVNAACAACIGPAALDGGPPPPTGALIYDENGNAYANLAGCVAVVDNGEACASRLEQVLVCEYDACGSDTCLRTATASDYDACLEQANKGVCATYAAAASACAPDETDAGTIGGVCGTLTGIVSTICGNGL